MTDAVTRWSTEDDDDSLAEIHRESWLYAYAGIIPGVTLQRMVTRRGPPWWRRMHGRGFRARLVEFNGAPAGYATLGPSRRGGADSGEIYELYLRPTHQGCGLGRQLFDDARGRLRQRGFGRLAVWALADNGVACRFYRAMGGIEAARDEDRFCGRPLAKIGFVWP